MSQKQRFTDTLNIHRFKMTLTIEIYELWKLFTIYLQLHESFIEFSNESEINMRRLFAEILTFY